MTWEEALAEISDLQDENTRLIIAIDELNAKIADGRLVQIPVKPGSTVYAVRERHMCNECPHNVHTCFNIVPLPKCPPTVFEIVPERVDAFVYIGEPLTMQSASQWDYEGPSRIASLGDGPFATMEEAEAAKAQLEKEATPNESTPAD